MLSGYLEQRQLGGVSVSPKTQCPHSSIAAVIDWHMTVSKVHKELSSFTELVLSLFEALLLYA